MTKPRTIFEPQRVGELALDEVRKCIAMAGKGVALGWPAIDATIKPLIAGNLCVVQAYTSNYKTGFMMNWARKMARNIVEQDWQDAVVVYVSWEDTVEEMGIYDLAHATTINASAIQDGKLNDAEVRRLEAAAFKRGALPLWVLGNSLADRREQPRMTLTQVRDALGWIEEQMNRRFVAIFLDYLNLIPPEGAHAFGDNRRTDIMELTYRARDLSFTAGAPVIMGAQSKRESTDRIWKLPQKQDAQESSAIEQYSHTMLSLWRPILTEIPDQPLKGPDGKTMNDLRVTDNLLILGLNKQKRGPAGGWWPLYVDPARNEIAPLAKAEADDDDVSPFDP